MDDLIKEEIDDEIKIEVDDNERVEYNCELCDHKASTKTILKRHIESVHDGVKYRCEICDYKSSKKGTMNKHVESVHNGVKPYSCGFCDYKAAYKDHLRVHFEAVHQGVRYNCQQCDYTASTKGNLTKHVVNDHKGVEYICEICDFKADNKNNLRLHLKSVEHILKEVQSVHEPVKYKCELCNYKANEKDILQRHIKSVHEGVVHDGLRYQCELCDYKTSQPGTLRRHVQSVHNGVRYSCEHCDHKASTKSNLNTHVQSVHEGAKYQCELCDYKATFKGNLPRHYIYNHSGWDSMKKQKRMREGVHHQIAPEIKLEPIISSITEIKAFQEIKEEPFLDIKEEPKDANDLECGLVCEPELENILVKEEPMDSDQEIEESEENCVATPFVSTVKEEPPKEQERPNYERSKSNMKVFPFPGGEGEKKKMGGGHPAKTGRNPLEFFSNEVKEGIMKSDPYLTEDEVTKKIIDRWMKMTNEEKGVYRKMVLNFKSKSKTIEYTKTRKDLEIELSNKIKYERLRETVSNEATFKKLKAILEEYMETKYGYESFCKICTFTCRSGHIMNHMETHVKLPLYSCEHCKKSSSNFRSLKIHKNKCPYSLAVELG